MRRSDGAVDPLAPPGLRPYGARRHARRRASSGRHAPRPAGVADHRAVVVCGLGVGLVAPVIAFGDPLPAWWTAVAVALHLASNGQYAVAVARHRARPNIVTWVLWGLIPMVAVAAQVDDRPGPEVAVTFVVGLGPLVVAAVALRTDRSAAHLTPFTLSCAGAAVVGVVAWQVTTTPALAVAFCILADALATLPTLRKAYLDPTSEHAPPYLLAMVAMLLTLGTVEDADFTAYGFPVYVLLVNALLFAVAAVPAARTARWRVTTAHPGSPVIEQGVVTPP